MAQMRVSTPEMVSGWPALLIWEGEKGGRGFKLAVCLHIDYRALSAIILLDPTWLASANT